eukprot:110496-Prymnesium_polylepis.2
MRELGRAADARCPRAAVVPPHGLALSHTSRMQGPAHRSLPRPPLPCGPRSVRRHVPLCGLPVPPPLPRRSP